MSQLEHHTLSVNGIRIHVAAQGEGPLVLLCHGWPELWYSWRHQLAALAEAGFRAVAPDMRGFGDTDAPDDVDAYSIFHLVGDTVGLVSALGEKRAVIVGHDWGAPVAWASAMMRPDVFPAVAALSVPHRGRGPDDPIKMLRAMGQGGYYWVYFQEPGVAEAELSADVPGTFRRLLVGLSGDAAEGAQAGFVGPRGGFLDQLPEPAALPAWLREEDVATFVRAYQRTGFRGGLSWYRNLSRNWALQAPFQDAKIAQPALFIAGARDTIIQGRRGAAAIENMKAAVPNLEMHVLDGAGHWLQQERPREVNELLVRFCRAHA